MKSIVRYICCVLLVMMFAGRVSAQGRRKVIIDQDASGPGGTDMQAILALVNAPQTDVLGITIVTGDAWRDEEVQHTLRMLEIIGRTEIPVLPGAAFPLVNTKADVTRWEAQYGKVIYQGAWNYGTPVHEAFVIPPMAEGAPKIKASTEDAAHFLIRMVHRYPHQVTIYEGGPFTNLALAIAIDPNFASLAKELIVMGGSIAPATEDPEFKTTPRREFNFWIDPEAARRAFHAPWARVVVTTVDISIKTHMTKELIAQIGASKSASAKYVSKYAQEGYLWDELAAAAWLDPSIITKTSKMYMDVSVDHGATYGDTLVWDEGKQPGLGEDLVEVQDDLDSEKFYKLFVSLMTAGAPAPQRAPARSNHGESPEPLPETESSALR